ncbi:MAG: hypothetical protein RL728_833 [Bacteroidota bacterium]|jgi:hypothetical protein
MNQKRNNTILFVINLLMLISLYFVVEHYRKEVYSLKQQIDYLEKIVINKR